MTGKATAGGEEADHGTNEIEAFYCGSDVQKSFLGHP